MADLTNIPKQTYFKTTLASPITAVQTADIVLSSVPSYTPGGETIYFSILDPDNPEVISCTGWNSGTGVLTGVVRGVALYDGATSSGLPHGSGITVVLSDPFNVYKDIQTAIGTKADGTPTLDGSAAVYADATARDAAVTSPQTGQIVTTGGVLQYYAGGGWNDLDVGTPTPNASTTVAGKVEIATQAQLNTGTDTGETGAQLVGIPSNLAVLAQDNKYTYAGTTAGSSTVYTSTVTPAPAAYAAGQGFTVLMDETNGASPTINFNGLGAKSIIDSSGVAIAAGALPSGALVDLKYNGTSFQVMSVTLPKNPVVRVYTANDTWNKPVGLKYVIAEVVAGGGGGSSANSTSTNIAAGGGGGGGGYARKLIAVATLGATETVTVGTGGAAGAAGNTSSFGILLTATGGGAGTTVLGGAGGIGSSGDVNAKGDGGGGGYEDSATAKPAPSGAGGGSFFGGGGAGRGSAGSSDVTGQAGGAYGGGGSGGFAGSSSATGGAGADGVVIVTEYY